MPSTVMMDSGKLIDDSPVALFIHSQHHLQCQIFEYWRTNECKNILKSIQFLISRKLDFFKFSTLETITRQGVLCKGSQKGKQIFR
jgi:hypothetical protein